MYVNLPAYVKLLIPFASSPDVTIYETSITFPSWSCFPKIPSPNIISYCSLDTSCRKKILESPLITDPESLSNKLSCLSYLTLTVESADGRTFTINVSKSIPVFGKINFWKGFLEEYVNDWSNNDPSYTSMSSKLAIPSITDTVLSSGIPKTKDCPPNWLPVLATGPFLRVKFAGDGDTDEISTKNVTNALEDFFERGTYPIFLASATTFSRKVAESMNTSFDIMFAL